MFLDEGLAAPWSLRPTTTEQLSVPDVVAEVAVDVAQDNTGRWRHLVRLTRIRTDMRPGEVPLFGEAG
ncbi:MULTISPECIES: hypothetical protein [unclassified Streptomyces]|uniref:hypothetical protein n=1 Tax=unclassified Streptomyces TaxID=2593676 RepID=UPI0036E391BA